MHYLIMKVGDENDVAICCCSPISKANKKA